MSEKKKHKGESIIGKIIYATLLFMPLMAIFVTCGYAIFNKNAYKSYSGLNENEINYIQLQNIDELQQNKQYVVDTFTQNVSSSSNIGAWAYFMNIEEVEVIDYSNFTFQQSSQNISGLSFYYNTSYVTKYQTQIRYNDSTTQTLNTSQYIRMKFKYVSNDFNYNWATIVNFSKIQYNENYLLDNVFYYSIEKVENSTLFNWTTSTGTYDVINRTTTELGIQNSFVDLLLTYWILLTIIYIIYDIGLCLVMMAHRKVHSLIDSVD